MQRFNTNLRVFSCEPLRKIWIIERSFSFSWEFPQSKRLPKREINVSQNTDAQIDISPASLWIYIHMNDRSFLLTSHCIRMNERIIRNAHCGYWRSRTIRLQSCYWWYSLVNLFRAYMFKYVCIWGQQSRITVCPGYPDCSRPLVSTAARLASW